MNDERVANILKNAEAVLTPQRTQAAVDGIFRLVSDLVAENRKLDREVEEEIQQRDRYHDAITKAHIALGGDGEWRAHVGQTPPIGESGHLHLDVPVMAARAKRHAEQHAELLYVVESKYPDETRHDTALRYLQEHVRDMKSNNQGEQAQSTKEPAS